MLSTANEKGFPSLYTTLQMPSFVKWILKGSSRKRESNISPGASQSINTLNSSPQKLQQKHLDVRLDRSQTLLQTQGIAFCRAMATGKWRLFQLCSWSADQRALIACPQALGLICSRTLKMFCCILCNIQPQPLTVPP